MQSASLPRSELRLQSRVSHTRVVFCSRTCVLSQTCRRLKSAFRTRSADDENGGLKECTVAVTQVFQALSQNGDDNRLESLMEYIPDTLLDKAIAAKKADGSDAQTVRFSDVMGLLRVGDFTLTDTLFDSFATRLLVYQQPSDARLLSSLMISKDKSLHRILVKSQGEESVLTVTMQLQEGLVSQYKSAPKIAQLWRLKSIAGELESGELPRQAGPDVGPEAVVAAQLEALRQCNVADVYEFASPRNKAATGSISVFGQMLESPQYKPLLGFSKAEPLRRIQLTNETYAEVVGVVSDNTGVGRPGSFVYVWSVGRVPEEVPGQAGFWMTNSVQLVSASGVMQPPM